MAYTPYKFGELRPLGDMEYDYLEAQLNKIGKRMFVEHFYSFKRRNLALLDKCPPHLKDKIYRMRINAGYALCEFGLDLHALYNIMHSPQMPREILITAKQIYEYELLMAEYIEKNNR